MKQALKNSIISDFLAYKQIVYSNTEKTGLLNLLQKNEIIVATTENIFSIIKSSPANNFLCDSFYPHNCGEVKDKIHDVYFDWRMLAIRVGMAASIFKHDNLLTIEVKDENLSFIPKEIAFLYFNVCFNNKKFDGDRMSCAPYFFGHDQCKGLLHIHDKDPSNLTEFAFSQICCLSYAHISIVLLAVRASMTIYKFEKIHIPVNIYCYPEFAANYHILKSLEDSKFINIFNGNWNNSSPIGLCDTYTILMAHAIQLKYKVPTCMGNPNSMPISLNKSESERIYIQEDIIKTSKISRSQKECDPNSILRIGIHSRDFTYKNQSFQNYRDTNINSYLNALIRALSNYKHNKSIIIYRFGVSEIRLQDKRYENIRVHDMWNKSQSIDQYNEYEKSVYSIVDMFIGTTSGPAHVAHWLGIPTLFLDSTNLFSGCELCQENTILALKTLKPLSKWWSLSPRQKSNIIKSDWMHSDQGKLSTICEILALSESMIESIIVEFLNQQLGVAKAIRLREIFHDYPYNSAVDNALISKVTANNIKMLFSDKVN